LAGFAVIGYGKLAGLELGYGSDLDLVFLHDSAGAEQETDGVPPIDNERFFGRLVQRLIHAFRRVSSAGQLGIPHQVAIHGVEVVGQVEHGFLPVGSGLVVDAMIGASARASSVSTRSAQSSNAPKPRSSLITRRCRSQSVAVEAFSRNRRSWLMISAAPRNEAMRASSAAMRFSISCISSITITADMTSKRLSPISPNEARKWPT
ncbi:MAG: hypothetical protein HC779_07365, partial [Phyllobacteriaceae bacterium]|nr:hypothetical protein [Phyllobacteriaceae bacterium]